MHNLIIFFIISFTLSTIRLIDVKNNTQFITVGGIPPSLGIFYISNKFN